MKVKAILFCEKCQCLYDIIYCISNEIPNNKTINPTPVTEIIAECPKCKSKITVEITTA